MEQLGPTGLSSPWAGGHVMQAAASYGRFPNNAYWKRGFPLRVGRNFVVEVRKALCTCWACMNADRRVAAL